MIRDRSKTVCAYFDTCVFYHNQEKTSADRVLVHLYCRECGISFCEIHKRARKGKDIGARMCPDGIVKGLPEDQEIIG